MPIPKKWSKFTKDNVKKLDGSRGSYELANKDKRIIDIGGSDCGSGGCRNRLHSHLRGNKYPTAKFFRVHKADIFDSGISLEASHSVKYQRKTGKKPRYTKRSPKKNSWF
jgi:hypothetical protein